MQRIGLALVVGLAVLAGASASAAETAATVQGDLDHGLRDEILRAIGEVKTPPRTRIEARRRARNAAAAATALLRSEGYYESQVDSRVSEADPPRAFVTVVPGPRFAMAAAVIDWIGQAPSAAAESSATDALGLARGSPAQAADVVAAETRAVLALNALGYADAEAETRRVIVDHADRTMHPTFRIRAGGVVLMGPLVLNKGGRTKPDWARSLATWKPGDAYRPEQLSRLERRFTDTGVYESASATLVPPERAVDGRRAVSVDLVDRPRQALELGAAFSTTAGAGFDVTGTMGGSSLGAYSTIEGSGVDAKWTRYNHLGVGDTTTLTGRLYDIQQVLDYELDLPDWLRTDQTLKAGVDALNEHTPAYDDTGVGLRLVVERRWAQKASVSFGGYLDYVSLSELEAVNPESTPVGERLNLFIPTLLAAFSVDRSDSLLDPTRGWRLQVRLEPTYVTGARSVAYVSALAQASAYAPLGSGARTVIAARIELGSILGGALPGVPADRRFYSGGGGSVRGFGYQQVGPRLTNGTPEGGLSVAEASLELRQKVSQQWGVAAFVDAGAVGLGQAPSFGSGGVGVGVGVRYDLGFGPLRLDVATPVDPRPGDARVQVYVSLGQAF